MNTVKGRNQVIEMLISGIYYPIFCCKSFEFSQVQETIETTSVNSGTSREYEPGMTAASLSVSGVTTVNNTGGKISITYLIQESIRRSVQSMRITLTGEDATTIQISFNAIITSNTLSRQVGSYSQSVSGFVITGEPALNAIITPPISIGGIQDPLYLDVVGGETSVQDDLLKQVGVVILQVRRNGRSQNPTTGTPGNDQYKFVAATGEIFTDATVPYVSGEQPIYVLYKL